MSKIEVNEIDAQSGSTITVGSACKSVAVPGNVVKTNAVQASDAGNIISQSGTTITIGASGDTVSLASGASQSGFGRSGSVDWQTGSIKTATFTAANGEGYFCNTSGGAFTVNLPAGSAGAIVAVSDYTRTFQTNNLTISPNGSEKIGGTAGDAVLSTEGQSATFVYVDGTEGWINVQETSNSVSGETFISASGGNATSTCGDFKTHIFTGPGTFTVSSISNTPANNTLEYLVVAGGGGGGHDQGGGGGGGGFRTFSAIPGTKSPLNAPAGITATATGYPITVGAGGAAQANGNNSVFSTITSTAGGAGGGYPPSNDNGNPGGSGGGAGFRDGTSPGAHTGGSGNTPPVSPPQGTNGGNLTGPGVGSYGAGGGGGGVAAINDVSTGGDGSFVPTGFIGPVSGSYGEPQSSPPPESRTAGRYFAGGGGGRPISHPNSGGVGGGGNGSACSSTSPGLANMGGGGGHGYLPGPSIGTGGSGIVMIRYKFQ